MTDQILTGKTKLAGVMGWPVTHSKSPRLHGFWLRKHGLDGAYLPLAVHPDNLGAALSALPKLGFRGCNLTIPHKEAALDLCDRLDPLARRIGAVNTVVVDAEGHLVGSNTDAFGFISNLKQNAPAWRAGAAPTCVLGAGGAARAVLVGLLDEGVPEVRIVNRTVARATALADEFGNRVRVVPWGDWRTAFADCDLLVNSTALGMQDQPPLEIDLAALPSTATVNDIVYAPLETALLAAARMRGNGIVDGLGMLLHQARPGFASWFGVEPEVTEDLRAFVLGG
ncbi:shikimate dehydrogenase [Limibacillus halophilus]|uniref:Shikimate dehydrogenase (NADP(+)) n=1 Tax=Limibacillus halophilus TaxID=1579333 RepID=A0A839SQL9_9PROT|nr:shikimate dehydrogenase [Limibacillus halophilus]MBB3064040.1 shikimate dehydrogenase [Limibacillus halophilus]